MTRRFAPAMALALAVTTALSVRAAPPPNADPALAPWFRGLRNSEGASCCSLADCRVTDHWIGRDGYEAFIGGQWRAIPPATVLEHIDNPTGRAVACYTPVLGILCFVRPAES